VKDACNSKDQERRSLACTPDYIWRNRDEIFSRTVYIKAFVQRKRQPENGDHLKKKMVMLCG